MTDSSEAEKAWEEYWAKDSDEPGWLVETHKQTWLAAWSACAEKAAGVAENCWHGPQDHGCSHGNDIAAEIRRRLGGKQ